MRILVCGGRNYSDFKTLSLALRHYINPMDAASLVITGGATGADQLADRWCHANGVHIAKVSALWDAHGKSAGPVRNGIMLTLAPEMVIAFPGGRGTADMCRQAKAAGITVMKIEGPA